jgi:hypothetical protein
LLIWFLVRALSGQLPKGEQRHVYHTAFEPRGTRIVRRSDFRRTFRAN